MEALMAKRKEILLGVLMVIAAVVFWKNFFGDGTVIGPGGRSRGAAGGIDYAAKKVFPVEWELLTAVRPGYDPQGRNIFQFGKLAPPPAPKINPNEQKAIDDAKRRAEEARLAALRRAQENKVKATPPPPAQAPRSAPPPPAEPAKPKPPPIKYKFIGYLGPSQNKIAVLHDGTDMVFVSSGDELEQKFRILDIGYESIKFGYLDPQFKEESRTLPMTSTP